MPLGLVALILPLLAAQPASANGQFESNPWRFDSTADRANKAAVVDLIERKKGGFYDSFKTTNNYYQNTYFAGDQVNCNLQAVATGSSTTNNLDNSVGSNSVTSNPSVSSDSALNTATSTASVNDPSDGNGSGTTGPLTTTNQDASGSSLNSSISGSTATSSTGTMTSQGNTSDVVLNNNQTLSSSPQSATVSGSSACAFNDATGTGSP